MWSEVSEYENYVRTEVYRSDTEEVLACILDRYDNALNSEFRPYSDTLN